MCELEIVSCNSIENGAFDVICGNYCVCVCVFVPILQILYMVLFKYVRARERAIVHTHNTVQRAIVPPSATPPTAQWKQIHFG